MTEAQRIPTPWLSVLIPVYNVESYLAECVESVMKQADCGVEILLLDDCSTDGSAMQMQTLAQRWPGRLRLLQHMHNQGLSAARNTMMDEATGGYLWFLDSDDKLLPGAVSGLKQIVHKYQPDVVLCDYQIWRQHYTRKQLRAGELHHAGCPGRGGILEREPLALACKMLLGGEMHAWSKIGRRSLWNEANLRFPPGKYFEDMATSPRLALLADTYFYQPKPWVAYRQRSDAITSSLSLNKLRDWSGALYQFRQDMDASTQANHPDLRFALAHACARNLRCVVRELQAQHNDSNVAEIRLVATAVMQDFNTISPLSAQALQAAYLRRGAWLRLRHFLRTLKKQAALAGA